MDIPRRTEIPLEKIIVQGRVSERSSVMEQSTHTMKNKMGKEKVVGVGEKGDEGDEYGNQPKKDHQPCHENNISKQKDLSKGLESSGK
ncbi:unnamed protein product [Strongylus vulgaris]|uniref:Uncharacterized protein n=1 Tax=Strongylus vulgaris TaxID=40348 RepID=A0A3P7LBC7_STRVU|nr:unnamed protein product [Strongylus vulgaris]